jgi:hypothetical protein
MDIQVFSIFWEKGRPTVKKLLALVVIGGLFSLGCNPGTTKATRTSATGAATTERTSGGAHTGGMRDTEKMPSTETKEKESPHETKKATEKKDTKK